MEGVVFLSGKRRGGRKGARFLGKPIKKVGTAAVLSEKTMGGKNSGEEQCLCATNWRVGEEEGGRFRLSEM